MLDSAQMPVISTRTPAASATRARLAPPVLLALISGFLFDLPFPIAGPLPYTSRDVARGEMAFMRHCQECHTFGERSFAPALNDKPALGWLIRLQVRVGLGAMPSFSKRRSSISR